MNKQSCFILFILYMLINSDVFVDSILATFPGAVNGHDVATFGALLQAFFLILFYTVVTSYLK